MYKESIYKTKTDKQRRINVNASINLETFTINNDNVFDLNKILTKY